MAYHVEQLKKIKNIDDDIAGSIDNSLSYLESAIQLLFDKAYYNLEHRVQVADKDLTKNPGTVDRDER